MLYLTFHFFVDIAIALFHSALIVMKIRNFTLKNPTNFLNLNSVLYMGFISKVCIDEIVEFNQCMSLWYMYVYEYT